MRGKMSAPGANGSRADWQRWIREGADPTAAPITVAAALRHRRRRSSLARADAAAAEAATEIADLSAQLAVQLAKQPTVPKPTAAERKAAADAAWRLCKAEWQAERARAEPRADLRARHRAERDRVYDSTRPGIVRGAALSALMRRQVEERTAARTDQLVRQWTAAPRESFDDWIARRAAKDTHPP
ncbi:hypothetical protein ACFQU7_00860 [Pseudoroseomonas wenyumeiae]